MKRSTLLRLTLLGSALAAAGWLLSACSGVQIINATVPSRTYTLTPNLAYGPLHREQLDVYTPTSPRPAGGWPLVVFFYGGTWVSGERADYKFVGEALASRGIVALVADYRLYPEVRYPDFLIDSARALAYGLDHATSLGADPKRVFVMGHSAGGYNAAMLALDPRWLAGTGHSPSELAGWIGLAGPYDFYPIDNADAKPVFHHPDYPAHSQPIDDATSNAPPAFLAAARKDDLVSPERSTIAMANKLSAAGVPVTLRLYDRLSHTTLIGVFARPLRWWAPVLDDLAGYVERLSTRENVGNGSLPAQGRSDVTTGANRRG